MFQYWFESGMSSAELIDRMHEIADTCTEEQIKDRIAVIKRRATKAALTFNEVQTCFNAVQDEMRTTYENVDKEDLENRLSS
jgi:Mg-chelatase subunit ChlI